MAISLQMACITTTGKYLRTNITKDEEDCQSENDASARKSQYKV